MQHHRSSYRDSDYGGDDNSSYRGDRDRGTSRDDDYHDDGGENDGDDAANCGGDGDHIGHLGWIASHVGNGSEVSV
jgi:hypothetical protein